MKTGGSTASLVYARNLYAETVSWYRSAETKAQIVLTIDGLVLGFLANAVLARSEDVRQTVSAFGPETWLFAGLLAVGLLGSIASCVECLRSRTYSPEQLTELFRHLGVDKDDPATYRADVMWFFQMVSGLDGEHFKRRILSLDEGFETEVLAGQVHALAQRVVEKHRWINRAFFLTGASLVFLLLMGVSYVLHI